MSIVIRPETRAQLIIIADLLMTTPLTSTTAASPPQIAAGCTAKTYAMVIKVVRPAITSVLTSVPRWLSLKSFSMIFSFSLSGLISAYISANTGTKDWVVPSTSPISVITTLGRTGRAMIALASSVSAPPLMTSTAF